MKLTRQVEFDIVSLEAIIESGRDGEIELMTLAILKRIKSSINEYSGNPMVTLALWSSLVFSMFLYIYLIY